MEWQHLELVVLTTASTARMMRQCLVEPLMPCFEVQVLCMQWGAPDLGLPVPVPCCVVHANRPQSDDLGRQQQHCQHWQQPTQQHVVSTVLSPPLLRRCALCLVVLGICPHLAVCDHVSPLVWPTAFGPQTDPGASEGHRLFRAPPHACGEEQGHRSQSGSGPDWDGLVAWNRSLRRPPHRCVTPTGKQPSLPHPVAWGPGTAEGRLPVLVSAGSRVLDLPPSPRAASWHDHDRHSDRETHQSPRPEPVLSFRALGRGFALL